MVGRKSTSPWKLILTTDSYESKIKLLNSLEKTEDFTNTAFITNLEKVQQFFLSLYSISTDIQVTITLEQNWGNIQSHFFSDVKLIKYWHRLYHFQTEMDFYYNLIRKECVHNF